jgi:hypothetical protein
MSYDVFGRPTILCLMRPDPVVVASFGGGSRAKHWGSPYGCQSVRGGSIHRRDDWMLRVGGLFPCCERHVIQGNEDAYRRIV